MLHTHLPELHVSKNYIDQLIDAAGGSQELSHKGFLVYADTSTVDSRLGVQIVLHTNYPVS